MNIARSAAVPHTAFKNEELRYDVFYYGRSHSLAKALRSAESETLNTVGHLIETTPILYQIIPAYRAIRRPVETIQSDEKKKQRAEIRGAFYPS